MVIKHHMAPSSSIGSDLIIKSDQDNRHFKSV
jgi:hypothetical protein